MKDDEPEIYRRCMSRARDRIAAVRWLYDKKRRGRVAIRYRTAGYLTRKDFENLYDVCGEVLVCGEGAPHAPPVLEKRSASAHELHTHRVFARIERLIASHLIRLVGGNTLWLVTVLDQDDCIC